MESSQGKSVGGVIAIVLVLSLISGGVLTYAVFPRTVTVVETVEVEKPVYIYVNNTVYENQTVIEYRNNTEYIQVQPGYQGNDMFVQQGNATRMLSHVQNLTFYIVTNWSDDRVTTFYGYRYSFICNGTHILSNLTLFGLPDRVFGVVIFLTDKAGFWIFAGENYSNQAGEWTIPLKPVSISQGWIYGAFGQPYNVGLDVVVNYT